MSHIDSDIDAYISKKTDDEWHTQIESKNLQTGIHLSFSDDGPGIVELSDLNIVSIEEMNKILGSPKLERDKYENNDIAGVVTGTNYPSTYNQYNFVAGISKTVGNVIFTSTFQLTLLQTTSTSYTQVYLKPLMLPQNRTTIQRFLTNNDIFEKSYIYRPFDRNFGVSKDLRLYLHYGIEKVSPETIIYYLTNYYRRRFTLSEPKIAYSFNDTNEIIYEVIYSDIIDYNIGNDGISIPSYFEFRNRAFTPSSIDNMRKSLEQNLKFTENFNPKFMKSAQPGSLNKLGYIPCVIYCYTLPGKGKIILNRIKNYGLDFNTIDFDVNQLTIRQLNLPEDIPVRYLNRNGSQLGGFGYS